MKKCSKIIAYVDGASRGNPGPSSLGVVLYNEKKEVLGDLSIRIGNATNNIAEYYALIFAMQEAIMMQAKELALFTDSELLAKQYSGEYKIKDENLKRLAVIIAHLKKGFKKITVSHVPREENTEADKMANQALDQESFL